MKNFLFLKSIVLPIVYLASLVCYCFYDLLINSTFDGPFITYTGIGIYLNEIFEHYLLIIFVIFLIPVICGIILFAKYRTLKTLNMNDNEIVKNKLLKLTKLINADVIVSTLIVIIFFGLLCVKNEYKIVKNNTYFNGAFIPCVPGTPGC